MTTHRLTDPEFHWTPGAATDVTVTWRRYGWTPPSELAEYQAKWDRYYPQRREQSEIR